MQSDATSWQKVRQSRRATWATSWLASLGITSIDLTSQPVNRAVNGNVIVSKAGYTTADGKRHEISDVGLSTEVSVPRDGTRPVSAAALAFADYASKGYAAMAAGQARAIAAAIQGIPSSEQAAISALQQRFVLPTGTGFDQASFEARAKMSWAVQAGLVRTALNDKITYFVGPDGDRATIPAASRRNTGISLRSSNMAWKPGSLPQARSASPGRHLCIMNCRR